MVREHKAADGGAAGRRDATAARVLARRTDHTLWSGLLAGLMLLLIATVIGACAPIYRNHGYVPAETDLSQLKVGSDTRDTVSEKVGRPTALGLLNDEGWYYVQSRYKIYGPKEPKEIEREVVAITFDEGGTVRNIERFGLEDGRVVTLSRRVTDTSIQQPSLVSVLFRNFGRVAPSSFLK